MRIFKVSYISVIFLLLLFGLVGCGSKQPSTRTQNQHPSTSQNSGTKSNGQTQNSPTNNSQLTLENITYSKTGVLLILTHGDMKQTYTNPRIISGNPKKFAVTLKNVSQGKYPLSQQISINKEWAQSLNITKSGSDLVLTITIKPDYLNDIQPIKTGIGGGFEISFDFISSQHQAQDEKISTPPSTQSQTIKDIIATLKTRVPLMLPTSMLLTGGKYLTGTTTSQNWYYKTQFYETNEPTKINTQAVSNGTSIAIIEGTEYQSSTDAKKHIYGYTKINTSNKKTIDLGHGIKGVTGPVMGHDYIMWNEGRWFLKIDTPMDEINQSTKYPDSKELAKAIVTYLHDHSLPAPQSIGVITVSLWKNSPKTTVQWQFHQMTYQVTSNDPLKAIKTAVAMRFTNS